MDLSKVAKAAEITTAGKAVQEMEQATLSFLKEASQLISQGLQTRVNKSSESLLWQVRSVEQSAQGIESEFGFATKITNLADGSTIWENPDGLRGISSAFRIWRVDKDTVVSQYPPNLRQSIGDKTGFATFSVQDKDTATYFNPSGIFGPKSATRVKFTYDPEGQNDAIVKYSGRAKVGVAAIAGDLAPSYLANLDTIRGNLLASAVSPARIESEISRFQGLDQELARRFMSYGVRNSSDFGIRASLRDINSQVNAFGSEAYTASPASSGNLLAYMYIKANRMGGKEAAGVRSLTDFEPNWARLEANGYFPPDAPGGVPLLVFDDPTKLSSRAVELLQARESWRKASIVDLNGFDRGINFTDFASGQVGNKLATLVTEARALKDLHGLSVQEAVDRILFARQNLLAERIGANIVRPSLPSLSSGDHSMVPDFSNRALNRYLESTYPDPAHRYQASEILAHATDYYSLTRMADESRQLHNTVLTHLARENEVSGIPSLRANGGGHFGHKPGDNLLYVSGADHMGDRVELPLGSSGAAMSYLYAHMNRLDGRFVSPGQLLDMQVAGTLAGKRLARVDDFSYSGMQAEQITNILNRLLKNRGLEQVRTSDKDEQMLLATLGAYDGAFASLNRGLDLAKGEQSDTTLLALRMHKSLTTPGWYEYLLSRQGKDIELGIDKGLRQGQATIFEFSPSQGFGLALGQGSRSMKEQDLHRFLTLTQDSPGYHHLDSYQLLPYMTSDSTAFPIRHFAKYFLGL